MKPKILDIHLKAPAPLRKAIEANATRNRRTLHAEVLTWLEAHRDHLERLGPDRAEGS